MCLLWVLTLLTSTHAEKWAVFIAGSNGYYNYRHQADVCHAYQILRKGGFPESNIITMMYDDIANSEENPVKGNIINRPGGPNVYIGTDNIDYTGHECTADNVIGVLNGTASGKTLGSGPNDDVFFYFADHGAPGLVAMPEGEPLYADQLMAEFERMFRNKQYNEMVVYIEACESGSMMANLTGDLKIYATTAATGKEPSYATYWDDKRNTYLGDEYSIHWMEDSDKYWQTKETLEEQYKHVVNLTTHSHPQQFGDFAIDAGPVKEFQAEKQSAFVTEVIDMFPQMRRRNLDDYHSSQGIALVSNSRDVVYNTLRNRALLAQETEEYLHHRMLLDEEKASRAKFDSIFKTLAFAFVEDPVETVFTSKPLNQKPSTFSACERFIDTFRRNVCTGATTE